MQAAVRFGRYGMISWPVMLSRSHFQVVPECDAEFGCRVRINPRNASRLPVASVSAARAATDLALGDMETDIALGAVDGRSVSPGDRAPSALRLLACSRTSRPIERDEASASLEDVPVEAGTQFATAPRGDRHDTP